MTEDAGLVVASYGSYYRAGLSERRGLPFARVLETAVALGTGTVRVWAGAAGSVVSSSLVHAAVIEDLQRISEASRAAGVTVAMEFHADTLNDVAAATLQLIERVDRPNLTTLWQPPTGEGDDECVASLRAASIHLRHLHVFHWWPDHRTRHPLQMGEARWRRFLRAAQEWTPCRFALLEFVKADCVPQLADDAATLLRMLEDSVSCRRNAQFRPDRRADRPATGWGAAARDVVPPPALS
jgi:sugar phosphate isomerase/epimerase